MDRTPVPAERIIDLQFYDKMNGILVPANQGTKILITSDQGLTWRSVQCTPDTRRLGSASFIDSPRDIVVVAKDGNIFHSHNGGNTWQQTKLAAAAFDIVAVGNGRAYVSAGDNRTTGAFLFETTDFGRTWTKTPGKYDWDSFQFAQDQCDPDMFYMANEDAAASWDGLSCIFVTTDKGTSWRQYDQHPITYHCGSITTSKNAVFVQTINGVYRSTDKGVSWINIGGPPHHGIDNRLLTAVSNSIVIAVDTFRRICRTANSGGYFIPDANNGELTWYPVTAFARDSVSLCDSMVFDTIDICPTCKESPLVSSRLAGADASDYTVVSFKRASGPCYKLIVGFKPSRLGTFSAQYELSLANGNVYSIPLEGRGHNPKADIAWSPQRLFDGDTVSICDIQLARKLHITSSIPCGTLRITRIALAGIADTEYTLQGTLPTTLSGVDSIEVVFTSGVEGLRPAELIVELEDGTVLTIPLAAVGVVPKPEIQFSQPTLFTGTTLCVNDSTDQSLHLSVKYCFPLDVASQILQGTHPSDYSITQTLPNSVTDQADLTITFRPLGTGLRDAELVITFADGSVHTINLEGNSFPTADISLAVDNASTDTLGGLVKIPFSINGLPGPVDVTFSLAFDHSLEFLGAFSPTDVPIGIEAHTVEWAHIMIGATDISAHGSSGYVAFRAYSDSGDQHTVRFDSLGTPLISTQCIRFPQTPSSATVISAGGCGTGILSQFLRTNKVSAFSIAPNPVNTELNIISLTFSGSVEIEVVNMIGERLYRTTHSLELGGRHTLRTSQMAEGLYFIRISSASSVYQSPFVVTR